MISRIVFTLATRCIYPRNARWVHEGAVMLRTSSAKTSLVVCSSCRFSESAREDENGRRGGALFAESLNACLADHPCRDRIEIQPMACLYACGSYCSAYIRSERRFGYILGRFAPSREHAVALLDYVVRYLNASDGVVPYSDWPHGIKGHFLARVPPDGFFWDPS
jgi:predicted metal-binding protein